MSMEHEPLRYAHSEGHTDVCYAEDGNSFISVGADGDVRIWSIDNNLDPKHSCIGEWALSVVQKGDKLYVATGTNDIQILSLTTGDRDGILQRFSAPINHLAVAKSGNLIALAGEDMEVRVLNIESDDKNVKSFTEPTGPCLSVALSPNAKYLAAGSGDCNLRVWNVESSELLHEVKCFPKVNSFENAELLCRMDFEPKKGALLAYPLDNSVVLLDCNNWSEKCTLNTEDVGAFYTIVQFSPCGKYLVAATNEGDFVVFEVGSESVISVSKHEKGRAISGLMWNPLGTGEIVYTDTEGYLSLIKTDIQKSSSISNEIEGENIEESSEVDFGDVQFEDDDDEDNENAISLEKLKRQYGEGAGSDSKLEPEARFDSPSPRPRTPELPLQAPFMPSSTPDHLDPRYLCWNDVGVVRSYGCNSEDEGANKSIEVEFHDCTFHSSMMLPNYQDYFLASISKGALIVANLNHVEVIPLSASTKEWKLTVESYEEITLVAASDNYVCFATSNYIVRVCTIYGTQRAVFTMPGPLVSMSAYTNVIMVAYHSSGVRKLDQCINIKLIKLDGMKIDAKEIGSALGPESTLFWIGFSDVGTPAMMDSLGMLCMYPLATNMWMPFCDTVKHRVSPADGFFITTIFETNQTVAGIKCRGSVYPGFTPRPTLCELPLQPCFADSSSEKTQMEMNVFCWSTLQVDNTEKRMKENALKLFALACKTDMDQRALEFMELMANPQLISLGTKYASKLNKKRLVEKMLEIASKVAASDEGDEENVRTAMHVEANPIKPIYKKLTLSSTKRTPKNKIQPASEVLTPSTPDVLTESMNSSNANNTLSQLSSIVTTQDLLDSADKPKNPFLKNLKPQKTGAYNPLSLTDKFAGMADSPNNTPEVKEKRKQPDSETEKQAPSPKQRKLDRFMFSKQK